MVAAASFWRCVWSPTGTGNVLLVWADPEASGLGGEAPLAVWADNEALGRLVAGRFVQHFAEFRDRGVAEMAPRPAGFASRPGDGGSLGVTCSTDGQTIELTWSAPEGAYLRTAEEPYGGAAYHVSSVLHPCAQGGIAVNGRRLPGRPLRSELDGHVRLIARDGPAAVTHRAVAAEANLTKSVATYHFATLDDLLTAALVESTDSYARQAAADLPADCSLSELAQHMVAFANDHREEVLASYELFLHAARRPTLRAAALRWTEWTTGLARRYTDDPVAVDAFVAALDGLGLHALLADEPLDPQRAARVLTRLLSCPLGDLGKGVSG
jgi:DNA-binding transcriptional regulator YbjK